LTYFSPWRWRRYIPPKCRSASDRHGFRTQKTVFLTVTAVRASDPFPFIPLHIHKIYSNVTDNT
jgi:hypothetical protein